MGGGEQIRSFWRATVFCSASGDGSCRASWSRPMPATLPAATNMPVSRMSSSRAIPRLATTDWGSGHRLRDLRFDAMNPIVLGALISAGPVLAASALGARATVRTAGVSAEQTELTLAADPARWLRDKQSDVYVATIRFVQDATMHRPDVIRYIEHNLDLPEEIHETIASYEGQPLRDLLVMAQ